jgi:plastocyanin
MRAKRLTVLLAAVALVAAACGTEGDSAEEPTTIDVTGVDYAFEGVPSTVSAGSTLTFTNGSSVEAHELVAMRIPDAEMRPLSELLQLPEEEFDALFPDDAEPAVVFVAMPESTGMAVVGDGTLNEPGRYGLFCFFPVGGDPDGIASALEAMGEGPPGEDEGPPDLGDGPPHFIEGMYAELNVE